MPQTQLYRPEPGHLPERTTIPDRYKWQLAEICRNWDEWTGLYRELADGIEKLRAFEGTLSRGGAQLLAAFKAQDAVGALMYRVWYFASLQYDQDQRDNGVNARRQQVQILFAKHQQAVSWFNPELLQIPADIVRGWMQADPELAIYRFAIESLWHEQEHVLDAQGERLMSYSGR